MHLKCLSFFLLMSGRREVSHKVILHRRGDETCASVYDSQNRYITEIRGDKLEALKGKAPMKVEHLVNV